MFNLVKIVFYFFKRPLKLGNSYFKQLFYFILLNKINFLKKRIIFSNFPTFNQSTLYEGKGMVYIGYNCSFGYKLGGFHRGGAIELQARYNEAIIKIGNNISTNNNIMICAANYIEIGDDTLIGQYVTIMDFEAHGLNPNKRKVVGEIGKVIIGKNVWIGNNVIILKNSEIGDNTIIAAGAIVNGKFPANVIIGGIPSKIIKPLP